LWTAELGGLLMLVGLTLLVLVSDPRRVWSRLGYAGVLWKQQHGGDAPRTQVVHTASSSQWIGARFPLLGGALIRSATKSIHWMLGR
jgi:hypothetical protein